MQSISYKENTIKLVKGGAATWEEDDVLNCGLILENDHRKIPRSGHVLLERQAF